MPKKTARKSSAKKKTTKKRTTRKTASKAPAMSSSMNTWTKPRMHNEQMEFHSNHPNAKSLILIFLIVTGVFVVTYMLTMM